MEVPFVVNPHNSASSLTFPFAPVTFMDNDAVPIFPFVPATLSDLTGVEFLAAWISTGSGFLTLQPTACMMRGKAMHEVIMFTTLVAIAASFQKLAEPSILASDFMLQLEQGLCERIDITGP